jgi:hypothetical protein
MMFGYFLMRRMMNRPIDRVNFVKALSDFVKQHNKEIGTRHGLTEGQLAAIMEDQDRANKELCAQIYDFLRLEGFIDG